MNCPHLPAFTAASAPVRHQNKTMPRKEKIKLAKVLASLNSITPKRESSITLEEVYAS
jgi:hypothetical protein